MDIFRLGKDNVDLLIKLVELFNEVFDTYETVASEEHLEALLCKSEFYAIIAVHDDVVVGGSTAFELQRYYVDKSELYIYDIAVSTKMQRQGVGRKLIGVLTEYGRSNGVESIFVDAHSDDEEAVRFYQSTLGGGEKVDHFVLNLSDTSNDLS